MAAKPRVHEVAHELGIDSKSALRKLKEMGEFVKSPSSTIQVPVARKLRAAFQAETPREVEPESQHPEAVAARVRRDIVRREDDNWKSYGFSDRERTAWRQAGIPENKAHIAAMCRDSEARGTSPSRLAPTMLNRRLGTDITSPTVLDVLLDGSNYLRVQERLAARLGVELTGINAELLRLTTSSKLIPERMSVDLGSTWGRIEWEPRASVRVADAVVEIINSVVPAARAQLTIRQQISTYRLDGTVSPLLAAYARVHGVMHSGELLTRLCDGITGSPEEWVGALDVVDLIERAVAARRFYYFRPDTVSELAKRADFPVGSDVLPPSPDGVALLLTPEDEGRVRKDLVFWTTGSSGVARCIAVRASVFSAMKAFKLVTMSGNIEIWEPDTLHSPDRIAASFLDRFAVRRSRPLSRPHPRANDEGRSVVTIPDTPAELRDIIVAYYPRSASSTDGAPSGQRRTPNHRWVVRGHSRRQWYPNDQTHRVIWIEEHESGATDHPLLISERVEVH